MSARREYDSPKLVVADNLGPTADMLCKGAIYAAKACVRKHNNEYLELVGYGGRCFHACMFKFLKGTQ